MRILITGGAGFIGSHLCEKYTKEGHTVLCLDNFMNGNLTNIRHLLNYRNFKLINGDIRDFDFLEKIMRDEAKKVTQDRRTQVGTGDRSEKIRTYNFPERRVTDHRINLTLYRLEAILEGDLEEVVKRLIKEERKKIYEAKGLA